MISANSNATKYFEFIVTFEFGTYLQTVEENILLQLRFLIRKYQTATFLS